MVTLDDLSLNFLGFNPIKLTRLIQETLHYFIVASSEKMYIVHQQEELFCHAQDSCGPSFPGKLKIKERTEPSPSHNSFFSVKKAS